MRAKKPIKIAIIGGGCGSIAAAFELTHPRQKGAYEVTIYQLGWRLGGKGASGRGAAGRIEEHGLHVWFGCYDNAFAMLRECYDELNGGVPKKHQKNWRDFFLTDSHIAVTGHSAQGGWVNWAAFFPPAPGLPGDPLDLASPFTIRHYLGRAAALLRTLLFGMETFRAQSVDAPELTPSKRHQDTNPATVAEQISKLVRDGTLISAALVIEAIALIEAAFKSIPAVPESAIVRLTEAVALAVRSQLEHFVAGDDHTRYQWEIIDMIVADLVGAVRFGLLSDPGGLDAINHLDCRQWLRLNGASERAIDSPFTRVLYDLALAYENGDASRPAMAAGDALRGTLRLFFNYRGALFWKMRGSMGDIVFAPLYKVLRKRGVTFKFFHRLRNVKLADRARMAPRAKNYVEALEFDVQAETLDGAEYRPLINVRGMSCWPAKPDFLQLKGGARIKRQRWDFESHWDRRKRSTLRLQVTRDFDFVVLGVSLGVVPEVCREIVAIDARWRAMVDNVKTVATQAFQIWLSEDLQQLGWDIPPVTLTSFVKPFDTWADMSHVIPAEDWEKPPAMAAYFCNILPDPPKGPKDTDRDYPRRRRNEVRGNAIEFLRRDVGKLWPGAVMPSGGFRWDLLADPAGSSSGNKRLRGHSRFDTQYWTANVNPSDRYVLSLPGSSSHRISPLDNSFDNLTIAGDWTACGLNVGCVEAAVMSGRLAAHALAGSPALEDIIGYDHP